MIVLDTNVISEALRANPDPAVSKWSTSLDERPRTTAVSVGELRYGLAKMPRGRRRTALDAGIKALLSKFSPAEILAYDDAAAALFGDVLVTRERAGRPIQLPDAQIAAICLNFGATLATRNTRYFDGLGLTLVNPWTD